MQQDIVSVIIPVFNRGRLLKEAVMSVLLQDYEFIEIIVIDDGSTDNTSFIAEEMAKKWPRTIKVFSQTNSGPGRAREFGTERSIGEFIQYLDSDDLLLPTKFSSQVRSFYQQPESGINYGVSYQLDYLFDPPLLTGPFRSTGEEIRYLFPRLLNERWWTTSCPLYRRKVIEQIGPWKDLVNEEDWEFDARAARLNIFLSWVTDSVSIRRINTSSDHLSFGGFNNPKKVSDRVIAKQFLFRYARESKMKKTDLEMRLFARECFLLSRQSAVVGLGEQSEMMFNLARDASTDFRRYGLDYIVYGLLGKLLGWERAGLLASRLRNML
jgi:glycosyltransferase involved in cell wall biosynthesis